MRQSQTTSWLRSFSMEMPRRECNVLCACWKGNPTPPPSVLCVAYPCLSVPIHPVHHQCPPDLVTHHWPQSSSLGSLRFAASKSRVVKVLTAVAASDMEAAQAERYLGAQASKKVLLPTPPFYPPSYLPMSHSRPSSLSPPPSFRALFCCLLAPFLVVWLSSADLSLRWFRCPGWCDGCRGPGTCQVLEEGEIIGTVVPRTTQSHLRWSLSQAGLCENKF
jgi:hypothetical protein